VDKEYPPTFITLCARVKADRKYDACVLKNISEKCLSSVVAMSISGSQECMHNRLFVGSFVNREENKNTGTRIDV
jgi:hypothetical protein